MKFVNAYQTKEERRFKYMICRMLGLPRALAIHMRDWNFNNIVRFFENRCCDNV